MEKIQTTDILGVRVAVTDMDRALALACENCRGSWRGRYICVSNVHVIVTAQDEPDLMAAENGAAMVLPDGGPLSLIQRRRGYADAGRVTGPDFMESLFAHTEGGGYRHYFYGNREQTLNVLRTTLAEKYPNLLIAGMKASVFRPLTKEENREIMDEINASQADFVWVSLGAPRQELWMAQNAGKTGALMIGIGGAFDMFCGNVKRAPAWMQRCCLEWLYRLMQEPRRLFKRYFVTNTRFLWLLWKGRGR